MTDAQPQPGQPPRKKSQSRRRRANRPKKNVDIWRPVPELDPPKPIRPAKDPTAVLHSLGDPPLQGQGAVAEHYMAAVVQRAALLATALAAAGNLLADNDAEAE